MFGKKEKKDFVKLVGRYIKDNLFELSDNEALTTTTNKQITTHTFWSKEIINRNGRGTREVKCKKGVIHIYAHEGE